MKFKLLEIARGIVSTPKVEKKKKIPDVTRYYIRWSKNVIHFSEGSQEINLTPQWITEQLPIQKL